MAPGNLLDAALTEDRNITVHSGFCKRVRYRKSDCRICQEVCPENAIVASPSGKARMVDLEKCTGCKICLKACPWEMISYDPDTRKATKCHLCNGKPKCVEACPAEALSYIPWVDLTDSVPFRIATRSLFIFISLTIATSKHITRSMSAST